VQDPANKLDASFQRAGFGDTNAFAEWMSLVENPLRRSLARFARAVDVEVVIQETLLRMWIIANDRARRLEGENASLRFALRVARNVAREELRHTRLYQFFDDDESNDSSEMSFVPELPDPALGKSINECIARLPVQPRTAIYARIHDGHLPDRALAQDVGMKLNTFLQNIVRARKLVAECLEKRGVRLGGIIS
jgi:DNA-directed RNA polymerase specialized sigma24 family protein